MSGQRIRDIIKYVGIDEFSVMLNHVHGILFTEEDMVGNAHMRSQHRQTRDGE